MVKLFENTEKITQELASIDANRVTLQAIHEALKSLGAEQIRIADLQEVIQMNGGAPTVKELVFRGKNLKTTDGFRVNAQAIELPQKTLKEIMRLAQSAGRSEIRYGLFTVEAGTVTPITGIAERIREDYTIYATEQTAEIVKEVEKISELINSVAGRMGVNRLQSYNPLRDFSLWFSHKVDYTNGIREFSPDVPRLVGHLDPKSVEY